MLNRRTTLNYSLVLSYILLPFLSALVLSCDSTVTLASRSTKHAIVTFTKLDSIEIELPFEFSPQYNFTIDSYNRSDTNFLMLGGFEDKRIIEVDLDHQVLTRTIELKKLQFDRYPYFIFHYLNKDTILILRDISNFRGLANDSILYSINLKGESNGTYKIHDSPFRMIEQPMDSSKTTFFHNFAPFEFSGRRLFVLPSPIYSGMSLRLKRKFNICELGYLDLNGSLDLHFKRIEYHRPDESRQADYAQEQLRPCFTLKDTNTLIVSQSNSKNLHKVTIATGEFSSSNEEMNILPAPTQLGEDEKGTRPSMNASSTQFTHVLFDKEKKMTYRFAYLPSRVETRPNEVNQFRSLYQWVGAYDDALNLVGQNLKPNWFKLNPKPIFNNGTFISVNQGEDLTRFTIFFSRLDTVPIDQTQFQEFKDYTLSLQPEIVEGDIDILYRTLNIPSNSVVLTTTLHSCPSCLDYVLEYFLINIERMEEKGVYLVASEESASELLKSTESPNIIIERNGQLENLIDRKIDNPALMIWNGEKVTRTMVLNPKVVRNLDTYIDQFLEYL